MKKILALALAAVLLMAVTVAGTIAYLTDSTSSLVNTFTESDVDIDLTETDDGDNNANANKYKMVPGVDIEKDPKVTVKADSEACYVFVKIEKSTNKAFDAYMTYTIAEGWTELSGVTGVYYRTVAASDNDQEFAVLKDNEVKVLDTVTKEMMDALTADNYPKLTITAYAIQQAKGDTTFSATEAWSKLNP